jgi:hypothetical protein
MPTFSSTMLRLQPDSQGAGQTRPMTAGKGLAVGQTAEGVFLPALAAGGLLDAAHDVQVAADILAGGQEPWQGAVESTYSGHLCDQLAWKIFSWERR